MKRASLGGNVFETYWQKTLPYMGGYSEHSFYNPIIYQGLLFYAWKVECCGGETQHRCNHYYFSVYESGCIIQPNKDPRFINLYNIKFGNKPWSECYFHHLSDIVSFVSLVMLQLPL